MTMDIELPESVVAELPGGDQSRLEKMAGLSQAIKEKRDEAVQGRKASGIEETWLECEEAYLGMDDENRAEFAGSKWAKPMTMEGSLVRRANSSDGVKASAFVRLTARYVDAGAAKLGEIALPVDGKAFGLKATPLPELAEAKKDATPVLVDGRPVLKMAAAQPDPQMPAGAQPAAQPAQDAQAPQPLTVGDLAAHQISLAEAKAKKAETRIYDWMVEYNHAAEMRKVIFDAARIGSGVIKGPMPEEREAMKYSAEGGMGALTILREVKPAARWRDPWDIYPDPGCGEDIHEGEYLFERDVMLPSRLRKLGKQAEQGWIPEAIKQVLEEGPDKSLLNDTGGPKQTKENKRSFTLWHFYGQIKREELALCNPQQAQDVSQDDEFVFVIATLVNDTVVRVILNPLDSGRFPYRVFKWRRRAGHWAGVGVAEQIRTPQRIVNAATRRLLDNAGKSSGSIIAMDPDSLEAATGGPLVIGGGDTLAWRKAGGVGGDDIRKLIATFQIPNMTPQLMEVIQYGFKLAEEQSSIPLISQGQSGDDTPDTFGGQQLQDNNANQMLRDIGFALHDDVTDPLVRDFYEWLMLDPDVPDDEKGDMQVDISGAIALIEKAMQRQVVMGMGNLLGNPAFRIDPAKWFEQYARMNRLVPSEFQYTEDEWAKISANPPPPPPQVQAAQIRAQAQVQTAQSRDQLAAKKIEVDTDRDTAYTESLAQNQQAMAALRMRELEIAERTANLNYQAKLIDFATRKDLSLEDAKVQLAKTTMELRTQVQLATGDDGNKAAPQVADAPTEPPGRAKPGHAFEQ